MTRKEIFNDVFSTALAQKQGIKVEIASPDMPLNEIIVNPPENVKYKIEYYNAAYDDEMKLKHNPNIVMMNPSVHYYY